MNYGFFDITDKHRKTWFVFWEFTIFYFFSIYRLAASPHLRNIYNPFYYYDLATKTNTCNLYNATL